MDNTPLVVRAACPADYAAVSRLLLQIAQLHHEQRPDVFLPASRKYDQAQYNALLDNPDTPVLVAEDAAGRVLGYAMCQVLEKRGIPVMVERKYLYIDDLCVDEHARGQGIGERLMEGVVALARERGLAQIELNVWESNEGARRFYERMGFTTQRRGLELQIL